MVPHNDFQNKIATYLQGSPDDAFTWFAGYRMQYYAKQGLLAPIDDVWEKIGANFSPAMKKASTGPDGKMYFVPNYNYPWGFFYRKSLWAEKGYEVPTTFDALKTLSKKMKSDGLIPIEFADKDGWPAMGTFDYINMRLNGYQFHMDLTAHKESWDQKKVSDVFDTWKELLPYQNPAALGMTWQDSAISLGKKKSGMYLLGSFVTQQFTDKAILDDIDFFPFPEIAMEGQDAVEAPIDGLLLSKKGGTNQAARDFMAFMGIAGRAGRLRQGGPVQHRHGQGRRHRLLQPPEQEVRRCHRQRQEHQPVLRPRRPARHGQQRHDPRPAGLPQGRFHRRQKPRSPGQGPLRSPVTHPCVVAGPRRHAATRPHPALFHSRKRVPP